MTLDLTPSDITLRLICTVVGAGLIGLDRSEHGRNAGLRTNILVGLASALSMLLANELLSTVGKANDSFVNFDVMRLPLGILTGIGFIGAGAIMRRGELVRGVTTAATLWYVTVMGLCFGAGELSLGFLMTGLGLGVLVGLKSLQRRMNCRQTGRLTVLLTEPNASEEEIVALLKADGYQISLWAVDLSGAERRIQADLSWFATETSVRTPPFAEKLNRLPGVRSVSWMPRA